MEEELFETTNLVVVAGHLHVAPLRAPATRTRNFSIAMYPAMHLTILNLGVNEPMKPFDEGIMLAGYIAIH